LSENVKNLFVTGTPGIGKTTLIKECTFPFREYVGGFYTEEIKENNARMGFLLKTFSGYSGVLAAKGMKSEKKLNKYGIDLNVLDQMGTKALVEAQKDKKVVVVDEIGSMEIFSSYFCDTIAEIMGGKKPLLATIRLKAEPFTSQIKKMSDTELLQLDRENFPSIKEKVRAWLEDKCFSR